MILDKITYQKHYIFILYRTPSNGKRPLKVNSNIIKIYLSHNFFLTFCYNFVTIAWIIRGEIKLPSVRSTQLQDAPYAHIRVSSFTRETHNELVKVLKDLDKKNKGIILDLRQNPGGLVTSVVDIAGEFLDEGSMVMYEIKGNGQRKNWLVKSKGNFKKLPMVVLVNEYSASGSEVLSGALQDHDRAIVIGTTTFGKGSVGIQRGLSNGGGIFYTVARWYTPLGRMIENVGLKPDVVQKQPGNETDDLQLKAAITQLNYQLDGES